jgi:hypothetical protein
MEETGTRISIKAKLAVAFFIPIAVAVAIALLGIQRLGDLNATADEIVKVRIAARAHVNSARLFADRISRIERDTIIAERKAVQADMDEQLRQLPPLLDAEGKAKLTAFNAAWQHYLDLVDPKGSFAPPSAIRLRPSPTWPRSGPSNTPISLSTWSTAWPPPIGQWRRSFCLADRQGSGGTARLATQ